MTKLPKLSVNYSGNLDSAIGSHRHLLSFGPSMPGGGGVLDNLRYYHGGIPVRPDSFRIGIPTKYVSLATLDLRRVVRLPTVRTFDDADDRTAAIDRFHH